jgi:hypothetical protein
MQSVRSLSFGRPESPWAGPNRRAASNIACAATLLAALPCGHLAALVARTDSHGRCSAHDHKRELPLLFVAMRTRRSLA